jgi:Fe-S protein assembly co-chaperone HscB
MDLDLDDLDRRYLELSRACHPDHSGASSPAEQVAVLERSARLNDGYRELRDPWRRAARILELQAPGVMDRTKRLAAAGVPGRSDRAVGRGRAGAW